MGSARTSIAGGEGTSTRTSPNSINDTHNEGTPTVPELSYRSRFQSTVMHLIGEAIAKAKQYRRVDRKALFIMLPVVVSFIALIGSLYVGSGDSARDIVCKISGSPSFVGCHSVYATNGGETEPVSSVNNALLVQLQIQTFDNVVENSRGIGKTAVEIRRTGIVMSELQALLDASNIAGRYALSEAISEYRTHSFHVGRGLEQFRSNLLATLRR